MVFVQVRNTDYKYVAVVVPAVVLLLFIAIMYARSDKMSLL